MRITTAPRTQLIANSATIVAAANISPRTQSPSIQRPQPPEHITRHAPRLWATRQPVWLGASPPSAYSCGGGVCCWGGCDCVCSSVHWLAVSPTSAISATAALKSNSFMVVPVTSAERHRQTHRFQVQVFPGNGFSLVVNRVGHVFSFTKQL